MVLVLMSPGRTCRLINSIQRNNVNSQSASYASRLNGLPWVLHIYFKSNCTVNQLERASTPQRRSQICMPPPDGQRTDSS